jgi:hypothetical protein
MKNVIAVIYEEEPARNSEEFKTKKLLYTSETNCYGRRNLREIGHLEKLGIVGWTIVETDLKEIRWESIDWIKAISG